MPYSIEVTQDFINHRTEKSKIYNPRGRTERKFLMDLDAEIYEHDMIQAEMWEPDDDWRIDGHITTPDGWLATDVKFISKYYNLTPVKVCNILQQRNILHGYLFMEWVKKPNRPLQVGDTVETRQLGYIRWEDLADNIKVSQGYNKWGTSHYVDVRRLIAERHGPLDA